MYPPRKTITEREDNERRKLALTLVPPSFSLTERGYWFLCLYGGSWMKLAWLMTVATICHRNSVWRAYVFPQIKVQFRFIRHSAVFRWFFKGLLFSAIEISVVNVLGTSLFLTTCCQLQLQLLRRWLGKIGIHVSSFPKLTTKVSNCSALDFHTDLDNMQWWAIHSPSPYSSNLLDVNTKWGVWLSAPY